MSTNEHDAWKPARLLPTVGIRGQEEQERRATSALLAVMRAVPEFGHGLLKELGAPKSPAIQTFCEVRFRTQDGRLCIPDGAIVCERGRRRWMCLIEVKTGSARLRDEQIATYLDIARENGFDAVLTISNQITADSSESPVTIDGRKLRRVNLFHFSWWRILTEATMQSRYRGISDPDQAWILDELIAYLEHPAAGAGGFTDMGEHWVAVRRAAHDGTLRASEEARSVAERWEEFLQYLALSLSQDLGQHVTIVRARRQTTTSRIDETTRAMASEGHMTGAFRIPGAIGDVTLTADLRTRQTLTSVTFPAPSETRQRTRITWLLRQLKEAPRELRIDAAYKSIRQTVAGLLEQVAEQPDLLLCEQDPRRELRSFTLTLSRRLGQKRGRDEGSFVRETRHQLVDFYGDLVQNLKPWQAPAPKLREAPRDDEPPQDERRPTAATPPTGGGDGTAHVPAPPADDHARTVAP